MAFLRHNILQALKYLEEFIWEYGKGVQIHETMTMQGAANHPVYLVVFLIHVLAHDPSFPAPDCGDEKIYAEFLRYSLTKSFSHKDEISSMLSLIFLLPNFLYHSLGSPLFVTVQALVNGNLVDGNLLLKSYATLYLRSIFNAIKKAEDAVDVQMTPVSILLC